MPPLTSLGVSSLFGVDNSSRSDRFILLVFWYGYWITFAFALHLIVGRCWSQSRDGAGKRSQSCLYWMSMRRTLGGDDSPSPSVNVGNDTLANVSRSPSGRGRRSATVGGNAMLSRSNRLASQASTRSSSSVSGEDASARNSRGSLASQTPPNPTTSTSLVPWGSALTLRLGFRSLNTRNRRTHLSGPVRSQSHRRPRQNAVPDIFEPRLAETVPLLTTLLAWTTLPRSPPNNYSVFEPRPVDSIRITPLFATLYSGLGDLTIAPRTKWFILVVAVTCKEYGVIDPEFDLAFLQKVFGRSRCSDVRFEWLAEEDATLEKIRTTLISLYQEAQETRGPFRLCTYLTGIGDGESRMCLFGDEVVSEQELGSWTLGLHDRATGSQYSNSICAIFDCCRETMKQRDPMDSRLGLVWSSSVGKPPSANAHPLGDGLPMSCFLIALFSLANDIITGSNTFGEALRLRLEQLGDFLRFCYDGQHEANNQCKPCKTKERRCLRPATQVPEWDSVGLDTLAALAELIKTECSEYALEVSHALARKMKERGFPAKSNDCHFPPDANGAFSSLDT